MVKEILELLKSADHYGQSEFIEIAKGKYKIPDTWLETFKQQKRKLKWHKK
jgi:hypothetical protein